MKLGDFLMGLGVGLLALSIWYTARSPSLDADLEYQVNSRARYPNEQQIAEKACGSRKLMSWWITDPRGNKATMHVRCSGVVMAQVEVKF